MRSNAAKGVYWKNRTRHYLEDRGYTVGDLELMSMVRPGVFVKRDQFASDLIAVNGSSVTFVQVKGGQQARGLGTFPQARRAFEAFDFPPTATLWIAAWRPGARAPRIINARTGRDVLPILFSTTRRKGTYGQDQARRREAVSA